MVEENGTSTYRFVYIYILLLICLHYNCVLLIYFCDSSFPDAKKDNDFIYHERIPEERALATIAKAAVAKPTALPEKFGNMDKTLFDNLVPVVVHQAMAAFDVRKKEIVNREITRLKEATNLANAAMASMNLPAAIEITGKNNELPQVCTKRIRVLDSNFESRHFPIYYTYSTKYMYIHNLFLIQNNIGGFFFSL